MTDDRTEDGILRMRMRHWLLKHCTKGEEAEAQFRIWVQGGRFGPA